LPKNSNLTTDDTDNTDLHGSKKFSKTILLCNFVASVFIRGEIFLQSNVATSSCSADPATYSGATSDPNSGVAGDLHNSVHVPL